LVTRANRVRGQARLFGALLWRLKAPGPSRWQRWPRRGGSAAVCAAAVAPRRGARESRDAKRLNARQGRGEVAPDSWSAATSSSPSMRKPGKKPGDSVLLQDVRIF